jgi:diaminohydroxyphosphoribosylaminopyrimidine deaminase/5-amino-6-(5-phosphoribosylamino)uracil reductase
MTGRVDASFTDFDRRAMERALALAERGANTTHPNPRVGCVIARGEQIIAEGWHERAGGPHAEAAALLRVQGAPLTGCTVYVTLEPCSHHGRTPPCAEALVAAHVMRVIYAIEDPNPVVAGKGAELLRAAGIDVSSGLLAEEAEALNEGFFMRMRAGRPFVRVKMGASVDGRIALATGVSRWITGEAARADVQRWRARSSAVLTGVGTVLADDPQLNVRLAATERQPLRVVLDSALRTPATAKILDASAPTLILTQADNGGESTLTANGARVERVPSGHAPARRVEERTLGERTLPGERTLRERSSSSRNTELRDAESRGIELRAVLARLGELQMNEVLVEAGPTLSGAFVQQGLVDELLLYIAPKLLGPQARPLFDLPRLDDLQEAHHFRIIEHVLIGEDLRLRLRKA